MRVLHIIASLDAVGGAELMLERLVLAQLHAGEFEPVVIALQKSGAIADRLRSEGIRVEAIGIGTPWRLPGDLLRLRRHVRALRPDIVQTWMYHADLLGGLAARLAGHRRVVWGIRNTDLFPGNGASRGLAVAMRLCARLSHRLPAAIVCVAEAARRSHIAVGYAREKMLVIQNGFDPAPQRGDVRREVRREFAIPNDALVIGSVGRFNAYKDHRTFVVAMRAVAEQRPDARFLMIGRDVDAGNPDLRDWIAASGHADRFVLGGERRDVQRCFAAMDIFCLHSKSEGFPNVLAEAMLASLPVVTTDVGDAGLLAGNHSTVIPPAAAQALTEAVMRLATLDPDRRRDLGRAARAHVEANYSMTAVTGQYARLYRSLLASPALKPDTD